MSEPSYKDGEVVWVKWRSCWWPGEVWESSRVPEDILSSLRKSVIAFVKFFQEDSFEFVRSTNAIDKYDCEKKLDYIKKGMDKYRKNSKIMSNFPGDVVKAEELTGGNVNILENIETPTKQKPTSSFETPERSYVESSPASTSKKSAGTYNSSSKVQFTTNQAPKSDKKFKCTLCDFTTERINLLMLHIKNHSSTYVTRVGDPSPTITVKKSSSTKTPAKKFVDPNDSIADDVRKIKESMQKGVKPATSAKKSREPAKSTPTGRSSRSSKKEEKVTVKAEPEETVKVEEKPKENNELKDLLADWIDDEDVDEKVEELPKSPPPKPNPPPEKIGESSKSIRNIPKKQRVSEVYIKSEPVKVEQPKEEVQEPPAIEPIDDVLPPEVEKKMQRASKRKSAVSEPEPKKIHEETDESLLMATADLLNDTEVPKLEKAAHVPSTFHKSNVIYNTMPPKQRSKRIFRARISRDSAVIPRDSPETSDNFSKTDNNGSMIKAEPLIVATIQNELMLPHKKKQSSRLITTDKPPLVRETRNVRETIQESPAAEPRTRKKRKSTDVNIETKSPDHHQFDNEVNSHEPPRAEKQEGVQSPLRDALDTSNDVISSETAASATSNSISILRRGQKRRNSKDSKDLANDSETGSEPKKFHKSEAGTQPKTIVASASEAICISSKGQLSVERRESVVTTAANTAVVTSQVIITEATLQPIVSTAPCSETVTSPKPQISMTVKIPLKNALMFPPEELLEMKKQGLVTVGIDKKNKLTEKGKQMFKKVKEKTAEDAIEQKEKSEPEQIKHAELPSTEARKKSSDEVDTVIKEPVEKIEEVKVAPSNETKAQENQLDVQESLITESNGDPTTDVEVNVSTNNNVIEKETIVADAQQPKENQEEPVLQEPTENGKDVEAEVGVPADDPNSGGAGLIALQAENFGGPPNCFYLCRQIEDRYEPVDNQILVLNAQNALVPYEGDIVSEDSLALTEVITENLAGYPQLSPNSNIIINTPNGQKIELSHFAIASLQEQADENGIATIEWHGEQLELNINEILEAISTQQEANESEALVPGAMLIDGDGALILDASDLPEVHHSATQVSETLTKPIMSTTVAPEIPVKATIAETIATKNLNIEDSLATIGVTTQPARANVPKSLELPITITNPTIAETVNHRKLANASVLGDLVEVVEVGEVLVEPDSSNLIVVQLADNGSQE